MPKISVIVPCFNVQQYIDKCVNSLLNQSFKDIEILLIDDGSNDKTGDRCDELAEKNPTIKVYHKKNGGLSDARNYGLKVASGEYIYFCDPDDYYEDNLLQSLIDLAIAQDSDMVICGYLMEILDKNGIVLASKKYTLNNNLLLKNKKSIQNNLVYLHDCSLVYNAWNKLYKKTIIDKHKLKYKNIPIGEDWEFNLNYLQYCKCIVIDSNCLYHYIRERAGALSTTYRSNWFELRKGENVYICEYFKKLGIYESGYEYLSRRMAERILGCLENEFSRLNSKSLIEKYFYVRAICNDIVTKKSFANMIATSKKVKVISWPIKHKFILLTFIMMGLISSVREYFPRIFFYLKSNR